MGLISTTIPNLVNGVSQQPYALRMSSQGEEQVNGYASVVEGLSMRPGTKFVERLPLDLVADAHIHQINRSVNEQYFAVITDGAVRVFDLNGIEQTVTAPVSTAYLASDNPSEDFRCITVADFTFILNTKITVEADPTLSPSRPAEAIVWVRQGSYGARYELYINGVSRAFVDTPDGSSAAHTMQIATGTIAAAIMDQLATNAPWLTVVRYGSTLHLTGTIDSISGTDSLGDQGMQAIKDKVQSFSQLPAKAVPGFTVEVTGDASSEFDNYFVQYTGEGGWKETRKPSETFFMKGLTLPHALRRNLNGTFDFVPITWIERNSGDSDSNPFPSFVGGKINDLFFHRDRLGFLSDGNLSMSRTGDYYNFFRASATAVLDSDPIDVGVNQTQLAALRHAMPFNKTLLLFSNGGQYQLGAAEVLTPATISINQTTAYECSLKAKPVGVGRFVYFPVSRGNYSGLREFFVDRDSESEEAADITAHVPRYIPGDIRKLAASGPEDVLVALSTEQLNEIYVYKYYWSGSEKFQSAWSRWKFEDGDNILTCEFIGSKLYLFIKRDDGVHLEVMDLSPGAIESNWSISANLDRRLSELDVPKSFLENDPNIESDNATEITLPYKLKQNQRPVIVTAPGGARSPGVLVTDFSVVSSGNNSKLYLEGQWIGQPFYVGIAYEFRYKFSPFVIKEDATNGGKQPVGEGRVQLRKVRLQFHKTGFFKVIVTPTGRAPYTYTYSGRKLGALSNQIGQIAIEQGHFSFPVAARNDAVTIEIVSNSYLPCSFLSAEWEAFFSIRSRRI